MVGPRQPLTAHKGRGEAAPGDDSPDIVELGSQRPPSLLLCERNKCQFAQPLNFEQDS